MIQVVVYQRPEKLHSNMQLALVPSMIFPPGVKGRTDISLLLYHQAATAVLLTIGWVAWS